ncbi:hypothetical protein CYY_006882 [Polysphondylium violaceum]|uniref:SCD domain-containing protein n=1 Tax=Polysphondylium violaceum TaxID=133409 RepID=A0A8J4PQL0_9MYCE|nr:hypothetical protein CYY_006882 [Polysphondylium violaceum]
MPPRKKVTKTTGDTAISKKRQITRKKKVNTSDLFEKIKKKCNVTDLLDDWIRFYSEDPERALYDLLMMVFECSGMEGVIDYKSFVELGIHDGASEMLKLKDQPMFPLGTKQNKNILANYKQFWSVIIIKCAESILFDKYFLEMMEQWFKELKSAHKRGTRYATAVACIQITESLISVANDIKKRLGLANRQYTSETKNTSRSKQLKENLEQLETRVKIIEAHIGKMFGVFDTLFKDVLPELRSICLMPLAHCILAYPGTLFADKYLEPIRRALNDWMTEPRQTAVQALITLYSNENISRLDSFTSRAKHRIVEIAFCDKVPAICIQAIHLVALMNQHELLDDDDINKICRLYLVDQKDISQAAGQLIYQKYFQDTEELVADATAKKKAGDRFKHRETQFNTLIEFVETSPAPNIPYYAVQALWPHASAVLGDWEFYVKYFEDIDSKDLSDRQLALFCQILNAAVRLAVGDTYDTFSLENRQPLHLAVTASKKFGHKHVGKKVLNEKSTAITTDNEEERVETDEEAQEPEQQQDQPEEKVIDQKVAGIVTNHFISLLPALLVKYRSNAIACENLIEICKYFTLDTYLSSRHQTKYNELLEIISSIFLLHSDSSLIKTTACTLEALFHKPDIPSQLDAISKQSLLQLYNSVMDALKATLATHKLSSKKKGDDDIVSSIETSQQQQEKDQEAIVFSVISNLDKLNQLAKQFYFEQEEFEQMVFSFTQGQINDQDDIESSVSRDKVISLSLEAYTTTLMWCLFNANPADQLLHTTDSKILRMFYQFCTVALSLLRSDDLSHSLRHYIVRNLVEIRSMFSLAYRETLMHAYSISMPRNNDLLEKNIELLFSHEEAYALDSLKVEFLKSQKETQEKSTLQKQNRKKKAAEKKAKSASAATTTDDEAGKTTTAAESTTGASSSDMDTSDKETTNDEADKEAAEQIDQDFIDRFEFDPLYEDRVEELVLSTCFAVRRLIVSPKTVWRLIEMIPLAPNRSIMDIVKTFLSEITMPTVEEEATVVKSIVKKFHSICTSDSIASSSNFQLNMFSRLKYLIQWMSSDFIQHPKSTGLAINDILQEIKLHNSFAKPEELLEILNFVASKSNEQATLYLIKNRIQFDDDYEFIELIEKLYNTIELQTIAEDTKTMKKSSKGKGKAKGKAKVGDINNNNNNISKSTPSSQRKRKRRTKKKIESSSEEDEPSESSEYSDEQDEIESDDDDNNNNNNNQKQQQQSEEEIEENSENSSDFEPSQPKSRKT